MLTLEALAELVKSHESELTAKVASFELRGVRFGGAAEPPALMGVVNLSGDSWYRESVAVSEDAAIRRGRRLIAEGAAIVDVGAESTLAHAARVDEAGQLERLLPVVRALAADGALVSVETYESRVAEECLAAGAAVINLTGRDPSDRLLDAIAAHGAGAVLCFVEGEHVRNVGDLDLGLDLGLGRDRADALKEYFAARIDRAARHGVERLWVDPGLGFYYRNLQDGQVRVRYQMEAFLHTFRLRRLGWPTCHALPHAFEYFEDEVRTAEAFFAVLAVLGKTDLLRTHEVPKVRGVLRTLAAFR
jgi:dihydropteroate synthase